jgi:glycosyltransferase involved in cell wall biosynthesis
MLKIEILTPNFNYGHFLGEAIESTSEYCTDRVVHTIIDGKSTDSSHAIIKAFQNNRSNVKWINENDKNQADALNHGISRSEGEWIGWLNSDEFYLEGALKRVLKVVDGKREYDIIYGDSLIGESKQSVFRMKTSHMYNRFVLKNYGPYISTCSFFVRAEFLHKISGQCLDDKLRISLDWDLFLELAKHKPRVKYLRTNIGFFRVHGSSITNSVTTETRIKERKYIEEKHNFQAIFQAGSLIHKILKLINLNYLREMIVKFTLKN